MRDSSPIPLVRRPTALVDGYPAAVLGRYLRDAARSGAFRDLGRGRDEVLAAITAISEAGDAYMAHIDRTSSATGTPEPAMPELDASSSPRVRIGVSEVADMLEVSNRYVRHLAPELGGQKVSGRWTFDPADVAAEVERRRDDVA